MTREEKALIYFKNLREQKLKDYSVVFDTAPKDSVVYGTVSAEIEIYDTAIKALEQEPCEVEATKLQQADNKGFEDCKQAVLDMATTIQTDDFSGNEVIEVVDVDDIKALPPVTPQQSWIPVSERLPDKGYSVYVTRITDDNCKYVRIASYQGDCWMDNTDEFNKPNPHKVIAWQPLPESYKGE